MQEQQAGPEKDAKENGEVQPVDGGVNDKSGDERNRTDENEDSQR